VVDTPKEAEAVLDITANRVEKVILSLNSPGRVREYQLRQRFVQGVQAEGRGNHAPATIEVRRDLTFNDTEVLAKQDEEPCSTATCRRRGAATAAPPAGHQARKGLNGCNCAPNSSPAT
jgi:outer membrane lipopolysaccharide assembly protein LptE/RlpB